MTLDAFLPYFVDHLEAGGIKKVIVMSLDDYPLEDRKGLFMDTSEMPKKMQEVFDIEQITNCLMNLDKIKGVEFIKLDDLKQAGAKSDLPLPYGPTDLDRDTSYYYTSGTTGNHKCVVYKESSLNTYLEMHAGLDTQNVVGERNFQCIPLTHMTGERVCTFMPLARGGILMPQPIYNSNTFARDLAATKANCVVATASFYMKAVKQGVLGPEALKHLTRPGSGGEPITKSAVAMAEKFNAYLKAFLASPDGKPEVDGELEWTPWTPDNKVSLVLDGTKKKAVVEVKDVSSTYDQIIEAMRQDDTVSDEVKTLVEQNVTNGRWFSAAQDEAFGAPDLWEVSFE
ncbi:MAG: AMP-binding protein [Coriobacteriales bacterium]|nr:AMP-binding protein [Coriobacteriales bacterium]